MTVFIRSFEVNDYAAWKSLYDQYQRKITDETHAYGVFKLLSGNTPSCQGYLAVHDKDVIGFAHFVFHLGIKHSKQILYMEDLFVKEAHRGKGVAKQLIDKGLDLAKQNDCGRFYWITDEDNITAQKVYEHYVSSTKKLRYAIELS